MYLKYINDSTYPSARENANQSPFPKCQLNCSNIELKHLEPQNFRTPGTCLGNQLRTDSNLFFAKDSLEILALPETIRGHATRVLLGAPDSTPVERQTWLSNRVVSGHVWHWKGSQSKWSWAVSAKCTSDVKDSI